MIKNFNRDSNQTCPRSSAELEQGASNAEVAGSNPAGGTILKGEIVNISSRVKNDIESYYVMKKFQGQEYLHTAICSLFPLGQPWHNRFFKNTEKFKNGKAIYIVRAGHLVEKSHVLEFCGYDPGTMWRVNEKHITGTNLYIYHDDDPTIPFWKHPKWGRTRPHWLPEDIEEHHIGKKIKNRQQVIIFLKMMKQQAGSKPIQLQLFK